MSTSRTVDVVVVGGGFAGIYAVHSLRERGLSVQAFEAGSDVGGTWYWNRYPGARCDVESLEYQYSFTPSSPGSWAWSERYATQPEILSYANWVADQLQVRDAFQFDTTVEGAQFDEGTVFWHVHTSDGVVTRARFVIAASGSISARSVPPFPGAESFSGRSLHPGAWPHEGVDLSDSRVGVIGVGSSGVQLIPEVAAQAKALTVFQRTPAYTIPARNRPLYTDEVVRSKVTAEQRREARATSPAGLSTPFSTQRLLDTPEPERTRRMDEAWKLGGNLFLTVFSDATVDAEANEKLAEYVRERIAEVVEDPEVAERLTPWDYPIGSKRIVTDTNFYATFNQPHVRLVDTRDDPIEEIVPEGIVTHGGVHELDVIIYATGYDNLTGALTRVDYRGRGGCLLSEAWSDGARTYLGIMTAGFPNLFMITGPQSPSVVVNMIAAIEQHVDWALDAIAHLGVDGATIEPRSECETSWAAEVEDAFSRTLYSKANSWYRGQNIDGKATQPLIYTGGLTRYREFCDTETAQGYPGFFIRQSPHVESPQPAVDESDDQPRRVGSNA